MDDAYEQSLRDAVRRNLPPMKNSAIFLAIMTDNYERDSLAVLQFGLAVLLDKPIYILVRKGHPIAENVRRLASGIEEYETEEECMTATTRLLTQARLLPKEPPHAD